MSVLKNSASGFLVEGYFHTYQPARHRALNQDYCHMEGLAYYRGIVDYYDADKENVGYIMGAVKDSIFKMNHSLFQYAPKTNDQWVPCNGAEVILKKSGVEVARYNVDTCYNGLFIFKNLEPGNDYSLEASCEGYHPMHEIHKAPFSVKANETTYKFLHLKDTAYVPPIIHYSNYPNPEQPAYLGVPSVFEMKREFVDKTMDELFADKTIRRVLYRDGLMYVLAIDADKNPTLAVVNEYGVVEAELPTDFCTVVGAEGLKLSDIAFTADGVLVSCNKEAVSYTPSNKWNLYKWEKTAEGWSGALWQAHANNETAGNYTNAYVGNTFAYSGTLAEGTIAATAVTTGSSKAVRYTIYSIYDGVVAGALRNQLVGVTEIIHGADMKLVVSPRDSMSFILTSSLTAGNEWQIVNTTKSEPKLMGTLPFVTHTPNHFKYAGKAMMAAPAVDAEGKNIGVAVYDITAGVDKAQLIKTDCYHYVKRMLKNQDYYTTDHNYNGVFVFDNLEPGKYTISVHASGYKDYIGTVTVTADKTTYPEIFLEKGQGTEPNINVDIKWVLNGGIIPGGDVPSNADLWETFKPYYNTYYGLSRADQTIENVATFANAYMQDIMTNTKSEYKWLGDYILSVVGSLDGESAWRWHVHAFFNCNDGTVAGNQKVATADFSQAGKPEAWGEAYQIAMGTSATLPSSVKETYTLPTPKKDGDVFVGWYDNPKGEGTKMTTIPAGYKGTIYAIWQNENPDSDKETHIITWVLNGGVVPGGDVPSNEQLIASFKDGYNTYFSQSIATTRELSNFLYYGNSQGYDVSKMLTDEKSGWKWLGDYLLSVAGSLDGESAWRWHLFAFFNCNDGTVTDTQKVATADFSQAGKPEAWGTAYQVAMGTTGELPTTVDEEFKLPIPIKEGYVFAGWFTNPEGSGTALTSIPAGWYGTLYAIWTAQTATNIEEVYLPNNVRKVLLNGQILIIRDGKVYNMMGQQVN